MAFQAPNASFGAFRPLNRFCMGLEHIVYVDAVHLNRHLQVVWIEFDSLFDNFVSHSTLAHTHTHKHLYSIVEWWEYTIQKRKQHTIAIQ